uniref:Uncharacterized protein n=1 Tax=Setaria viridis TaxID=4556 RepID=A0A4U6WEB7_SETVI|nr:hypothetical protein SEVIR_1G249000v2 [Setaria viridis]
MDLRPSSGGHESCEPTFSQTPACGREGADEGRTGERGQATGVRTEGWMGASCRRADGGELPSDRQVDGGELPAADTRGRRGAERNGGAVFFHSLLDVEANGALQLDSLENRAAKSPFGSASLILARSRAAGALLNASLVRCSVQINDYQEATVHRLISHVPP